MNNNKITIISKTLLGNARPVCRWKHVFVLLLNLSIVCIANKNTSSLLKLIKNKTMMGFIFPTDLINLSLMSLNCLKQENSEILFGSKVPEIQYLLIVCASTGHGYYLLINEICASSLVLVPMYMILVLSDANHFSGYRDDGTICSQFMNGSYDPNVSRV